MKIHIGLNFCEVSNFRYEKTVSFSNVKYLKTIFVPQNNEECDFKLTIYFEEIFDAL